MRPRLTLPSCIASVDPVLECRRRFVGLSTKMWVELYDGIARFGIMSTECMMNLHTNLENPKTYGLSGSVGYLGHGLQGRERIRGLSEIVETASPRIQRPQLRFIIYCKKSQFPFVPSHPPIAEIIVKRHLTQTHQALQTRPGGDPLMNMMVPLPDLRFHIKL